MKKNTSKSLQKSTRTKKKASAQTRSYYRSKSIKAVDVDPLKNLGTLPAVYGENRIVLMTQEPHLLFTYWDFDISRHPGGKLHLRICDAAGHVEKEIEIEFETRNSYLPAEHANAQYHVDLGYYRGEKWHSIGKSNAVQTPPDSVSKDESLDYAALPMHISFQRMQEHLSTHRKEGESLINALSRLREEGKLSGIEKLLPSDFEAGNRMLLGAMLDSPFAEKLAANHGRISETMHSLGEQLASDSLTSGALSSSLSHGFASEELPDLLSSWSKTDFSSWLLSIPAMQSASSFEKFRETLTSWSSEQFATWMQESFSSWSSAALSSWNQGSLSNLALSSLSSWGGSEMSSWGTRGFFMHVNAEVIFYGGTDPNATVWINGEKIVIEKDGTFRYHFRFPDKSYEISIVAESPDKVEQRCATLHFRRDTQTVGEVSQIGQPTHLDEPMGGKS